MFIKNSHRQGAIVRNLLVTVGFGFLALISKAEQSVLSNFGSNPIRILVGYSPGGGADLIARVYGQKLQEALGVPVVIENKPGAFEQLAAQPVIHGIP